MTLPQNIEWHVFKAPDESFSLLIPAKDMKHQEKIIETSLGETLLQTLYLKADLDVSENYLYMINFHEVSETLYQQDSTIKNKEFLEIMAVDIAAGMDAELLYSQHLEADTYSELEYRVKSFDESKVMKGKLILTERDLFSLQVYTTPKFNLNKNMDRFIESFRLMKK